MSTNNRRTFSNRSRIALSILAILASAADAQAITEWDLPGQPLANSLRDVAAKTDSNIIFDKKLVLGQSAKPLKTRATTVEALNKLLEGTGLTYRQLDDKTVTIQLASTDAAATTSYNSSSDGRIRLAQADTSNRPPRPVPEAGVPSVMLLEEIIVTGTNIRGIENNTTPITVLNRQYIDATGYSTTTKLLESVTQNYALANQYSVNLPGVTGGNVDQGSAVNLRGVGEGSTLILVNGRRIAPGFKSAAVDISALPLSAIERVEILPDGASALYGSDAVGGVVNFILREDFEGVETRLRAGAADGVNEYRGSQAIGSSWDSGNFVASLEYFQRDALLPSDRDFVPGTSQVGTLSPDDENYSGLFTIDQQLSGTVGVFANVLYTNRDTKNRYGLQSVNESAKTENMQSVISAGVDWNVAGDWQVELSGGYARNDIDQTTTGFFGNFDRDAVFDISSGELKGDGTLFKIPGGNVRGAVGVAYRNESYKDTTVTPPGVPAFNNDKDQTVRSAFAEVYVPIFGKDNAHEGIQRLELSIAGRYDDYSTAGSSFDPQYGIMWEPVTGLRLRARHTTSYKAPNLVDYSYGTNFAFALTTPLPPNFDTPQTLFSITGVDVDTLRPQESESASFGLEFAPEALAGFTASINYFKIRYTNLIATPAGIGDAFAILANPAAYPNLITFNPSAAYVNQLLALANRGSGFLPLDGVFDPTTVGVAVDGRRRNLSEVNSNGVDVGLQYDFKAGDSSIFLGLNGTYILNLDQQVTDTSPKVDTVDTIYNPTRLRARAFAGWNYHGFAANVFVNHTDSYIDNRVLLAAQLPGVTQLAVDSYTTVDVRFAYDLSNRFNTGALSGVTVALSAVNVLDEDPPSVTVINNSYDVGYDGTNADPLGRFVSLEITKAW